MGKKRILLKIIIIILLLSLININHFSLLEASINNRDTLGNDPWLSYLHDNRNTGYSDCKLSSSINYKWSLSCPGEQFSGKVAIMDGIVFTTSMLDPSSRNGETRIQAIDIKSGKVKWYKDFYGRLCFTGISIDQKNKDIYFATTDGWNNRRYSNGNSTVYCISALNGEEVWETSVDGAIFGSLVLSDEFVFCQTFYVDWIDESNWESEEGEIICFDKEIGDEVWETELNSSWINDFMHDTPPCLIGDYIIVPNDSVKGNTDEEIIQAGINAIMYLIMQDNGDIEWKIDNSYKDYSLPSVSSDDKNIYVSWTSFDTDKETADLYVESYSLNKKKNWSFKQENCVNWCCTPMQDDNNIYIRSRDGYIFCIDKSSGKLNWKKNCFEVADGSAMCILEGYLICAGYEWEQFITKKNKSLLEILDLKSGKVLWEDIINNDIIIQIAAYDKYVIFSGVSSIYCYEVEIPILEVSDNEIDFGDAKKSDKLEKKIKVWNSGSGDLTGEIKTHERWINIEPDKITKNSQYITISVDTDELDYGENNGEIEITTNGGDKNIPVLVNIIDDTPPELIIDYPENNLKTKDSFISISGRAIDEESGIETITVNGEEIDFADDGYFETDSLNLNIGTNKFTIIATNNAKLSTKVEILVIRDIEPPILTILSPTDNEIVYTDTITVSGYAIDQDSGVSKVYVNNLEIDLLDDSKFSSKVTLKPGSNLLNIKAIDKTGNEAEVWRTVIYKKKKIISIILTIGEKIAFIDNEPHILDAPPIIRNGRTLVPIRFIAEAFGAEVKFIPHPTNEVQIKYKDKFIHLWINSKKAKIEYPPESEKPSEVITLETPPIIINGRTLVPLRFIGETLGAKVDWNSNTQTITLTLEEVYE